MLAEARMVKLHDAMALIGIVIMIFSLRKKGQIEAKRAREEERKFEEWKKDKSPWKNKKPWRK